MSSLKNGFEMIENMLTRNQLRTLKNEIEYSSLPTNAGGIRNVEKKLHSVRAIG